RARRAAVELADAEAEDVVGTSDEGAEDDHRGHHDPGHAQELFTTRPDDLAQLVPDTAEVLEQPGAVRPRGCERSTRTSWGRPHRLRHSLLSASWCSLACFSRSSCCIGRVGTTRTRDPR